MKITSKKFPSPKGEITWYELTNAQGASVVLSTMGAGIVDGQMLLLHVVAPSWLF